MKKTTLFISACLVVVSAIATVPAELSTMAFENTTPMIDIKAKAPQANVALVNNEFVNEVNTLVDLKADNSMEAAKAPAADVTAFYLNPAGTMFFGIDRYGYGSNFAVPGVVGPAYNGISGWTWRNYSTKGATYTWTEWFMNKYPQYAKYGEMDANGNWTDSLLAADVDLNYMSAYLVPMLIADNGEAQDTFMLFAPQAGGLDTMLGNFATAAGCQNPFWTSEDGMWPLTNAIPSYKGSATNYYNLFSTDTESGKIYYCLGASTLTAKTSANADTTVFPAGFITAYEKPMSPLYINDITLNLDAFEYIADGEKPGTYYKKPVFDTLWLSIVSKDLKTVYARTYTTPDDMVRYSFTGGSNSKGWTASFSLTEEDEFGGVISKGVTMTDAFYIVVDGFTENDTVGVSGAINPYGSNKTYVITKEGKFLSMKYAYDPYLMLNGVYNTFESAYSGYGDTINIRMKKAIDSETSEVYYYAVHADGNIAEQGDYIPYLITMFLPQDTTTDVINDDVIITTPDDTYEVEFVVSNWKDKGTAGLWIEGSDVDKMNEDDLIKIEFYGREMVYKVVSIDEKPVGIEDIMFNDNAATHKFFRNGNVVIRKGTGMFDMKGAVVK